MSEASEKARASGQQDDDLGCLTYDQLCDMDCEPTRYIIPGMLPAGLTVFAAKPKAGKSTLMRQLCVARTLGRPFLDPAKPLEQGAVLYLAFEDTPARLKEKLGQLFEGARTPDLHLYHSRSKWPFRDTTKGCDQIQRLLDRNPRVDLVIIDTLEKFRSAKQKQDVIGEEYDTGVALKNIADDRNIAIMPIFHHRKMRAGSDFEALACSTGLIGSLDTLWSFYRGSEGKGQFNVTGRDLPEAKYLLRSDRQRWRITGEATAAPAVQVPTLMRQQRQFLEAIEDGPKTMPSIRKCGGKARFSSERAQDLYDQLYLIGCALLDSVSGKYSITPLGEMALQQSRKHD